MHRHTPHALVNPPRIVQNLFQIFFYALTRKRP
nr:MAG TPA: hypothetical protein [Caudoviricetes sp.]